MKIQEAIRRAFQVGDIALSRYLFMRPPRSMPFLVCLVTFRCNLRCRMCDFWRTPAESTRDELTTGEWLDIIDQGVALGAWSVSFTGGEPLLRRDLEDLIQRARERCLSVHVCTNGVLLGPERARSLAQAGVGSINVSVDSVEAAIHDDLRGRQTFHTVVANIRALQTAAPTVRVGISCVVTRRNYRGLARMVHLAKSLGVWNLRIAPLHTNLLHRHMDLSSFDGLLVGVEDLPGIEAEIRKILVQCARMGLHRNSRPFLRGIGRIARGRRAEGCVAGFATACVDPYGWVAPCPDMEGTENVRDKPLTEIWRSGAFQRLRRRVLNCPHPCWDTSYAELSLRFRMRSTLADPRQFIGELRFYLPHRGDAEAAEKNGRIHHRDTEDTRRRRENRD